MLYTEKHLNIMLRVVCVSVNACISCLKTTGFSSFQHLKYFPNTKVDIFMLALITLLLLPGLFLLLLF